MPSPLSNLKLIPLLFIHLPGEFVRTFLFVIRKSRIVILVTLYGIHSFIALFWKIPLLGILIKIPTAKLAYLIQRIMLLFNKRGSSIDSINLMYLAIRNMKFKKSRSIVTIGGMAIGIGAIVFLVSLGYGTQRMVVNRVARLDELRQADITTQTGSSVRINDKQLGVIKNIQSVTNVLPLINVVGRVNYQNSISDMVVYGVTSDYLSLSAVKPVKGVIFKSNDIAKVVSTENELLRGEVAGATTGPLRGRRGEVIGTVNYGIDPETWIRLRKDPAAQSEIIGYTRRAEGQTVGKVVWGGTYSDTEYGRIDVIDSETGESVQLGKWIQSSFAVWEKKKCDPVNNGCDSTGSYMRVRDEQGEFIQQDSYTALIGVTIEGNTFGTQFGQVLGESDETDGTSSVETIDISQINATGSALLDLSELASESAQFTEKVQKVDLGKKAVKQAVVNRAALSVLGLKEENAVGKEFEVSFVVTGNLLADSQSKVESIPAKYTIVGVVPENNTPFFYVPFMDLRTLGIENFTQAKLVAKSQTSLESIRRTIESLGFNTESVVDTVDQIEQLFATVRLALVTLGMVALGVAALGMFNTLTVSLLERTHEVGLMKTMGMKSNEVEDLFLTESVAMGLFGGLAGIFIGYAAGKLLSLGLSIVSVSSGAGIIDVSDIPLSLIALVLGMSLGVGLLTGIYPARRAKKISALNALRYE